MNDRDRAIVRDIFRTTNDNAARGAVSRAASILHRRASYHPDPTTKELLTELGREIEKLSPPQPDPTATKGTPDALPTSDRRTAEPPAKRRTKTARSAE